jgi:hypothetical protein
MNEQLQTFLAFVARHEPCSSWVSETEPIPEDDAEPFQGPARSIAFYDVEESTWLSLPISEAEHLTIQQHGSAGFWAKVKHDRKLISLVLLSRFLGKERAEPILEKCLTKDIPIHDAVRTCLAELIEAINANSYRQDHPT